MIRVANPKSTIIVIDATDSVGNPNRSFCRPSGHVVFVIQNDDGRAHRVRIPRGEFAPNGPKPGPPDPIEPAAADFTTVEANDVTTIRLKAKDAKYFEKSKNPVYKYNFYWADEDGGNEQKLDPDLEINN